jgi:hypothetical protein
MRIGESKKIDNLAEQLLEVLDRDAEHLNLALEYFNKIRAAVIKRDEAGLVELLERIEGESRSYSENEYRRQKLRKEIAAVLGWDAEDVRLSALENVLSPENAIRVSARKEIIGSLVTKVKTEHLGTAMFLSECSRLNEMLLRTIFSNVGEGVTYNFKGAAGWKHQRGVVNVRL